MAIPEEVIGIILRFAVAQPGGTQDLSAIVPCARVSSSFRSEVERLLYASITLTRPDQIVKCFKTIVKRRDAVARFIRHLSIELREYHTAFPSTSGGARSLLLFGRPSPGSGDDGRLLRSFALLVLRALHGLKNLQHYHLRIGRNSAAQNKYSEPFLPHTAPFKLRSFHCTSMDASSALFRFLKSQSSIEDFSAPDMFPPYPLGPSILPSVKSVTGTPELLKRLVPKRPVSAVHCTGPLDSENLLHLLPNLALSSAPITTLVVPVKARTACDILPSIARTLPDVELLSMPLPAAFIDRHDPYEVYQDETFARALGSFDSLKRVEVPTMDSVMISPPSFPFNLPNFFNPPPPPFNINGPMGLANEGLPGQAADDAGPDGDGGGDMVIDNVAVDVNVAIEVDEGNAPANNDVGLNPTNQPDTNAPPAVQNGQNGGLGGLLGQVLNQVQAFNHAMGQVVGQVNGILNGVAQGGGVAPGPAAIPAPMPPLAQQPPFLNPPPPLFAQNFPQLNPHGPNGPPPVATQPNVPVNLGGGGGPPGLPNFMNQLLGQVLGVMAPEINAEGNGNAANAGPGDVNNNLGNGQPQPPVVEGNNDDNDGDGDPLPFPGGHPPFPGLQLPPLPAFVPGGPNAFTFNGPNFDAILQFTPAVGNQNAADVGAATPGGVQGPVVPDAGPPAAAPGGGVFGAPPGANPQINIAHLVLTFPPVITNGGHTDANDQQDQHTAHVSSHTPHLTPAQQEQVRARERKLSDVQQSRAPVEQMILHLWTSYCPTLMSVKFEMAKNRYVVWRRGEDSTGLVEPDDGSIADDTWSSEYTPVQTLDDP
ncbi:uncharacterized protein EI90DRAFT_3052241 [Cantharellus anzutake]|uniref:uncharacterized protein n=1 Tax=Cantharellus anzutake TaxID=1750568 RepID=UPI001905C517|nr:uncharacterized protein EI90DRAFT_3052241 [Cantharellus anzutake]KAF8333512.1 hypothetical protein EI90DRAFT_3052241 [Cantharellus anzutake]